MSEFFQVRQDGLVVIISQFSNQKLARRKRECVSERIVMLGDNTTLFDAGSHY